MSQSKPKLASHKSPTNDPDLKIVSIDTNAKPTPKDKRAQAPSAAKSAIKEKAATATKGTKTPKTNPPVSKKGAAPIARTPYFEEISLRAYFLSETRQQNGIPGTPAQDWLEAEQQLREEFRASANAAK